MPNLVLFTSEECHYSIHKMAAFLGIGEDNVIEVQSNYIGKMDPKDLETKINQQKSIGNTPFAVVATLGKFLFYHFCPLIEYSLNLIFVFSICVFNRIN